MPTPPPILTLYTKPDCSLCDQLKDDLAWLSREFSFSLVECDISRIQAAGEGVQADDAREPDAAGLTPAQAAQLRNFVPVLAVNHALYYPPHDLMQLRTAIAQAMGSTTS